MLAALPCCPLVSNFKYAPRAALRLEKTGQTDRRTDGWQTVTLRLPLDVTSVIMNCWRRKLWTASETVRVLVTAGGEDGVDVTVLMMVLTTVTWELDSAGPPLLISFVVVVVTVSCWLDGWQTTQSPSYTIRYDTIRYGRLTCDQKLTRWPA